MTEVEFVDRKQAEKDAARAIKLLNASDESKVEAWFALQAVANQVGPVSNLGVQGLSWRKHNGRYVYSVWITCRDGLAATKTGAPATLTEARQEKHLAKGRAILARAISQKGGLPERPTRPKGTHDALVSAVSASPAGRIWIDSLAPSSVMLRLGSMVRVADAYGREGINSHATLEAHVAFLTFPNRDELIRQFPATDQARLKARLLRAGGNMEPITYTPIRVSEAQIKRLVARSGITHHEARIILRAFMDGRSKTKLIRAVNEAAKMIEQPNLRVAA